MTQQYKCVAVWKWAKMSHGGEAAGGRQNVTWSLTIVQNREMKDLNDEEYFAMPMEHDENLDDNAPQFSTFIPPADVPM